METTNLALHNETDHSRTYKKYISTFNSIRTSTGLKTLIAFLIVLFLFTITHLMKFPGSVGYLREISNGQKTLDLQASFSSTETYQRLNAFGEIGRQMYMRTMLTVDLVFPLSMFIFLFFYFLSMLLKNGQ